MQSAAQVAKLTVCMTNSGVVKLMWMQEIALQPAVMMRALVFAAALSSAAATLELTPDTFEEQVFKSGKSAFIKFFAPWCGHCKKMKPDWDTLAT
eukprot:4653927-Pleurochrysis_carterae.AAC.1